MDGFNKRFVIAKQILIKPDKFQFCITTKMVLRDEKFVTKEGSSSLYKVSGPFQIGQKINNELRRLIVDL